MILVSHFIDEKKTEVQDYKLPSNICSKWQGAKSTTPITWTQNTFFSPPYHPPSYMRMFLKAYDPHPCCKYWLLHNSLFSDLKSSVRSGNLTVYLNNLKSNGWYKFSNMHLCVKSSLLAHSTKISWRHLKDFHVELPPNYHLYKVYLKGKKISSLYYHLKKTDTNKIHVLKFYIFLSAFFKLCCMLESPGSLWEKKCTYLQAFWFNY